MPVLRLAVGPGSQRRRGSRSSASRRATTSNAVDTRMETATQGRPSVSFHRTSTSCISSAASTGIGGITIQLS